MAILSLFMLGLGIAWLALSIGLLIDRRCLGSGLITRCRTCIDTAVSKTIVNYEQSVVFSSLALVVSILILPGAAFLNALLGGSPFLLCSYLAIAGLILVQIVIEENPHTGLLCTVIAGITALTGLVILPLYAVWSFTLHLMNGPPVQGALVSLIVAVILYTAIAGLWTLFAERHKRAAEGHPLQRFAAMALFAVPICFVIFWFALMAMSSIGLGSVIYQSWASLLILVSAGAIVFALFVTILDVSLDKSGHGQWGGVFLSGGLGVLAITLGLALNWVSLQG
jgi:hypothetical protein